MKKILILLFLAFNAGALYAQELTAADVKALYKRYPTQKSDLCPACKLWVNPYFRSVADTERHMPLVTYYVYTKAHRLAQEAADVPRKGIYAAWHPADGQPDETAVYREANVQSSDMIAKGHCQAWILMAWNKESAVLSDTYTFNAGMEYQGQNIGTEIASEELCRELTGFKKQAVTDSVRIWCGTFGSANTYTKGKVSTTIPTYYYKILQYKTADAREHLLCYWMPNLPTEKRDLLAQRQVSHGQLVANLGFNPMTVFGEKAPAGLHPRMYYSDSTGTGIFVAKDPVVVKFKGRYLMYYSRKAFNDGKNGMLGWNIGIAESHDLVNWKKTGEIRPAAVYEKNGLCAPGALVKDGQVHLFYQTYGNGPKDAICHAVSADGINFMRDDSNPIFHPAASHWTNGRAIDAEVAYYHNKYFLYYATRDSTGTVQQQGVATAKPGTGFSKDSWKQATDSAILKPVLSWEGQCIEGASVIRKNGRLYMFYAGAYNNAPQQIGVAVSTDGIQWKRLSGKPFLANGRPGAWNSSESGHPCIFADDDGRTWLFYQGNNDKGKTWFLSNIEIGWTAEGPQLLF